MVEEHIALAFWGGVGGLVPSTYYFIKDFTGVPPRHISVWYYLLCSALRAFVGVLAVWWSLESGEIVGMSWRAAIVIGLASVVLVCRSKDGVSAFLKAGDYD